MLPLTEFNAFNNSNKPRMTGGSNFNSNRFIDRSSTSSSASMNTSSNY